MNKSKPAVSKPSYEDGVKDGKRDGITAAFLSLSEALGEGIPLYDTQDVVDLVVAVRSDARTVGGLSGFIRGLQAAGINAEAVRLSQKASTEEEAVRILEAYQAGRNSNVAYCPTEPARPPVEDFAFNNHEETILLTGELISAINLLRSRTGCTLREAKELADAYRDKNMPGWRQGD